MALRQIQQRLNTIRQPIIDWLNYYSIDNLTNMTEQQLIEQLIPRITELRKYAHTQNKRFEELLRLPISGENEGSFNWNIIITTYNEWMPATIERLGKPFGNLPYRQQWKDLYDQATKVILKMLQIRAILTQIVQPDIDDPTRTGIMDMLEEIKTHLEMTNTVYDNMIERKLNLDNPEGSSKTLVSMEEKLSIIDTYSELLEQQFNTNIKQLNEGFETIQIQEDDIQQAKENILSTINLVSPITAINGTNNQSIAEISRITQEILLDKFQEVQRLQNIINTQQNLINQQHQQLNQQINPNCQYQIDQWKQTAYYLAQIQVDLNCVNHF